MTISEFMYFIAWFLFGVYCRVLVNFIQAHSVIAKRIEAVLTILWLVSVVVLWFILLFCFPFSK